MCLCITILLLLGLEVLKVIALDIVQNGVTSNDL